MARDISSKRMQRLFKLMTRFISTPYVCKMDLFDEFGYSNPKALQRDLAFLRDDLYFDVVYDRGKDCYYLRDRDADFVVNCPLSEDEFLAMVAGINMAGHFIPYLGSSCENLRNKIKNIIPERSRPKGETLAISSTVNLPVSRMDPHVFRMIVNSIHEQKVLKVQYRSPYGKERKTRVHFISPWFIYFRYRAWYLWGKSNNYSEAGPFRISRIVIAEPVEVPFEEKPEELDIGDFAFNDNPLRQDPVKVELKIYEPFASSVKDVPSWYPCQKVWPTREGDAIHFTAEVRDMTDISRWILSAADCVEIISPDKLKKLVKHKAEILLSRI